MSSPTSPDRLRVVAAQHEEAADDMMLYERYAEAREHFDRAVTLLGEAGDVDAQFRVRVALARACRLDGDDAAAKRVLLQAAETTQRGGRPVHHLRALSYIAQLDEDRGDAQAAETRWAAIVEGTAGALADSSLEGLRAKALGRLAEVSLTRGDVDAAERHLDACEALVARLEDAGALAAILSTRARWLRMRGDDDGAEAALNRALAIYGQGRDLGKMATTLGQLGNLKRERGELKSARQLFQTSLTMAESASDAVAAASALTNLANIAIALDDPATAARHYAEVIDIATACNHTETLLGALVNLGNLEASAGNVPTARARYTQGLEVAESLGAARLEVDIGMLLAQLDARDGRLDAAEARVVALLHRAEAIRYPAAVARLRVNRAGLAQARGGLREAASGYAAGLAVFERLKRPMDAVAAGLALVDCALLLGELDTASDTLARLQPLVAEPQQREALDLRVAEARVRLAREHTEANAATLLALAAELDAASRPLEALGARLEAVDLHPASTALVLPRLAAPGPAVALETPLRLERDSILARHAGDLGRLDALGGEAKALGMPLLALRVGRRWCEAAAGSGVALNAMPSLIEDARRMDYGAELARLEALC